MPRRPPPREYYEEELYEAGPRPRRHVSRRRRAVDDDTDAAAECYRRKAPASAPPVEELDRLRIRGRASPVDYASESYARPSKKSAAEGLSFRRGRGDIKSAVPPAPPSPPSERERDEYLPPRGKKALSHRRKKSEKDDFVFIDERERRRGKGRFVDVSDDSDDSEDDVDDIPPPPPARRRGRSMPPPPPPPPAEPDTEDEMIARQERRRRKGKIPVEREYVREEVQPRYAHKPNVGRHRGKEQRESSRYRPVSRIRSWSRRRNNSVSDTETETESETESEESDDSEDDEDDEIVVRKNERGRKRGGPTEKITIRNRQDDSSPGSPSLSLDRAPSRRRRQKYIEPGYEVVNTPRPELPAPKGAELEVRHRGKKKGRSQDDMVLDRGDPSLVIRPPVEHPRRRKKGEVVAQPKPGPVGFGKDLALREHSRRRKDARDKQLDELEVDLYSRRKPEKPIAEAMSRGPAGEVSIMGSGAKAVPAAKAAYEDMLSRERGGPKARYYPEEEEESEEESDGDDDIPRRYVGMKNNQRDRLWTEITKDLVVREAIERAGYEYEETDQFYYIFSYLHYDDVSTLVDLSEEIRRTRRQRIHELSHDRTPFSHAPPPAPSAPPAVPSGSPAAVPPAPAPTMPPGYDKYGTPPAAVSGYEKYMAPPPPPPAAAPAYEKYGPAPASAGYDKYGPPGPGYERFVSPNAAPSGYEKYGPAPAPPAMPAGYDKYIAGPAAGPAYEKYIPGPSSAPGYEKYEKYMPSAGPSPPAPAGAAPPGYDKYAPPPMMEQPRAWAPPPWEVSRMKEREMVYGDGRWRPAAQYAAPYGRW